MDLGDRLIRLHNKFIRPAVFVGHLTYRCMHNKYVELRDEVG